MTDATVHAPVAHDEGTSHHSSTGLSNEKLAMWAFLGSECLLFGGLISVFLIYRTKPVVRGPEVHELYDIPFTSVSSFVLDAASERAEEVLRAAASTTVPADYFDQLHRALDEPPAPNPALRRAARRARRVVQA